MVEPMSTQLPWHIAPESYEQFAEWMESIWDAPCTPGPDGGVVMSRSALYDKWRNARDVARWTGGKPTAPTRLNRQPGYIYTWPNGTRAVIARDGAMINRTRPFRNHLTQK